MKKILLSILFSACLVFSMFAEPVYVCVGSFVNMDNALSLADKLKNDEEDVCISEFIRSDGQLFYRVLLNTNSEDKDKAREEADAALLKGAFIVVPKADDFITVIHKAKKAVPVVEEIKTEEVQEIIPEEYKAIEIPLEENSVSVSSPITLKSGATKIISSIADFAVFAKSISEYTYGEDEVTDADQMEDLLDFFSDLLDSDEFENSASAKELFKAIESIGNSIETFRDEIEENKNAVIEIDENITSDFSEIPGVKLNALSVKGKADVETKFDEYDALVEIKGSVNAEGKTDIRFNLRETPFKTFVRDMKGCVSFNAAGNGLLSEEEIDFNADVNVQIKIEIALCNSRGMGGVVVLDGNVSVKGNIDTELMEIIGDRDEEEIAKALDNLADMNLKFCIYDDDGNLHYLSNFNNAEALLVLIEQIDDIL